jgi:hypothetical protein
MNDGVKNSLARNRLKFFKILDFEKTDPVLKVAGPV